MEMVAETKNTKIVSHMKEPHLEAFKKSPIYENFGDAGSVTQKSVFIYVNITLDFI